MRRGETRRTCTANCCTRNLLAALIRFAHKSGKEPFEVNLPHRPLSTARGMRHEARGVGARVGVGGSETFICMPHCPLLVGTIHKLT